MRRTLSFVPLFAALLFTAAALLGPPRIIVTEVKGTPPTPGAVLAVEAHHHTDEAKPDVSARAITQRGGQRVTKDLTLTETGTAGRFGVSKQWENGTPWVLVFTIRQGDHAQFGTAEAMVKVDAAGRIVGIVTPGAENARGDRYPRALKAEEIEEALTSLRAGR